MAPSRVDIPCDIGVCVCTDGRTRRERGGAAECGDAPGEVENGVRVWARRLGRTLGVQEGGREPAIPESSRSRESVGHCHWLALARGEAQAGPALCSVACRGVRGGERAWAESLRCTADVYYDRMLVFIHAYTHPRTLPL